MNDCSGQLSAQFMVTCVLGWQQIQLILGTNKEEEPVPEVMKGKCLFLNNIILEFLQLNRIATSEFYRAL